MCQDWMVGLCELHAQAAIGTNCCLQAAACCVHDLKHKLSRKPAVSFAVVAGSTTSLSDVAITKHETPEVKQRPRCNQVLRPLLLQFSIARLAKLLQ